MRLLELLLLSVDALAFFSLLIFAWQRRMWIALGPSAAVLALAIHLIAEGYRWQMIPAYAFAGLVAVWGIRRLRPSARATPRRWLTVSRGVLGAAGLLIAAALPALLPVFSLPDPTGPYHIGTAIFHMIDESRSEIFTADPSDRRELMVQVWYPAGPLPGSAPAPYLADADRVAPALARVFNLPPFALEHLRYVRTHAVADAPMSPAQAAYPVLIFSHGRGGFRGQNTSQIEDLVSHGYIVVGIDHTYANAASAFPDGRMILIDPAAWPDPFSDGFAPMMEEYVGFLAGDVRFLIDHLEELSAGVPNTILAGRLDLNRIGVFGHSLGGAVAAEACRIDSRCKAGIDLDAALFTDVVKTGLAQPFMFLSRERKAFLQQCARLGEDKCRKIVDQQFDTMQAVFDRLSGEGYLITIAGMHHYNFSDLPLFTPLAPALGLTGPIDGQRGLRIVNDYTLAFFNKHLRGEAAALLDGLASDYGEIQMAVRRP